MGTGRTNSARAFRLRLNWVTPNNRANQERTGAVTVTPRMRLLSASGVAMTLIVVPLSVKPFFEASCCAAVCAPMMLPGR